MNKDWIVKLKELEGFDYVVLPILYLEFFVKKVISFIYKSYIAFDQWNFNRKLPK